jgi:hypothetical protein
VVDNYGSLLMAFGFLRKRFFLYLKLLKKLNVVSHTRFGVTAKIIKLKSTYEQDQKMYQFQIEYHMRTRRWSCNVILDGRHHELKNFDTVDEMMVYMLNTVPPEAR